MQTTSLKRICICDYFRSSVMAHEGTPDHLRTVAEKAPVTIERKVDDSNLNKLDYPYLPRALVAVDNEHPHGSRGHNHQNMSVLQQHVAFFDRNHDGTIYPWETYAGFRAIGFNILVSLFATFIIHAALSYATLESWIPHPLFPIIIKNIHRDIHGSDTGVYDNEGRFVPAKFEEIFSKYAKTHRDRLTFRELLQMTEALRDAYDIFGWLAAKFEWTFTYAAVKDERGLVPKDAVRGIYDGSVFEYLEKRKMEKKKIK